jgi:thiol-disulfide isomerase/thioredoxin
MHAEVVDVRDSSNVQQLLDVIKNNKVTLVLVYADWCGHCKTFKEDVWSKLKELPNRKLPLAEVNADVLAETPLAAAKIDGYPSVVPIGNDLVMVRLQDEAGNETNALPNARNMEMMTHLVASDPEEVGMVSERPTPEAVARMKARTRKRRGAGQLGGVMPPNVREDILEEPAEPAPAAATAQYGGSGALFSFLSEATQQVAPAVLLTGTAMIASKALRQRKQRRRSTKRRGTSARRQKIVVRA